MPNVATDSRGFSKDRTPSRNSELISGPCEGYSKACASGPHTKAEYDDHVRGARRLGIAYIVVALALYVGISYAMGWGVFR